MNDDEKPLGPAGEENPYRHLPRWPWAPVIRERAAWIVASDQPVPDRTRDIRLAVRFMTVVFAVLAIYGAYVRYVVAKGHQVARGNANEGVSEGAGLADAGTVSRSAVDGR